MIWNYQDQTSLLNATPGLQRGWRAGWDPRCLPWQSRGLQALCSQCTGRPGLELFVTLRLLMPCLLSQQGRPPYAASAEEVAKELKSKSGEPKSSGASSDGSLAENGVMAEEKSAPQMNGSAGNARAPSRSESAFNSDSKTCNTNPRLNALSTDSACRREAALEAAVLNKEE